MTLAISVVLSVWAGALGIHDWRFRRLPNAWLLLGLAFAAIYWLLTARMPLGVGLADAFFGVYLVLVCFVPLYAVGWMGAGDVKFLAVIGCLGGLPVLAGVLLYGSLVAGVFALLLLFSPRWANGWPVLSTDMSSRRRVPYGTCLAFGLIVSLWG